MSGSEPQAAVSVESLLSPSPRHRAMLAISEICAEQGFGAASAEAVAKRSGISSEDFEELFASEEACLTDAVKAILGEVMSVVAAAYSPDRSDWENGMYGIKAILELMAAHPSLAHLAYIDSRQGAPSETHDVYVSGVGVLCAMMDGLRSRTVSSPPRGAARGSFGAAEALVRREIVAGRVSELPMLLPELIYGATVAFIGQEDALWMRRRAQEITAR